MKLSSSPLWLSESGGQLPIRVGMGSSDAGGGVSPSLGGSTGALGVCVDAPVEFERPAAVALRIISRRFTDREPRALEITLIDSNPLVGWFPKDSSTEKNIMLY